MNKLLIAWSKLVSGNAANGVLQLAIFAVAAQALELAALGLLIVVQAYVRFVDGIVNFQSVNVLTNFMAGAQEKGDEPRLRGLVKAGLCVDFGTAFLATLVAILALPLAADWLGITGDWLWYAGAYALVISTRAFGAIEAALRCFDRFGAISLRPACSSLVILAGSLAAWAMNAGAQTFLLIWLVGEALANLIYLGWSMLLLRRLGMENLSSADARGAIAQSPGFWPMMWQTNATFGIRMLSQEADVLLAGAVLGPAAAGLLRAAKNLANLVGQLGRPLQQIASAPIARFVEVGERQAALRYGARIAGFAFAAGLILAGVMYVFAEPILMIGFGADFAAAATITVLLFAARGLYLSGVTLMPLLLALGQSGRFLGSVIAGTVAFFAVLVWTIQPLGLVGIGAAHIAFELVWAAYGWWVARNAVRDTAKAT
ncbi:hypothetical protein INR77_07250 [Erythrobacter sp. SCSIO 43205]|uniref:lipopolysaccharide biosynthesis protein n=1 Tax=Erythrobacter sp. SCSIO 43205 TaxID=2779361 RepID=UPI001CA838C7|nr:hypothetical protein [Erythrobacter sp. SCSIO 43205]UAB79450.1 hypothetical protein INR77_07250 [Erythrobacter sp. SCSIO 43205]